MQIKINLLLPQTLEYKDKCTISYAKFSKSINKSQDSLYSSKCGLFLTLSYQLILRTSPLTLTTSPLTYLLNFEQWVPRKTPGRLLCLLHLHPTSLVLSPRRSLRLRRLWPVLQGDLSPLGQGTPWPLLLSLVLVLRLAATSGRGTPRGYGARCGP
jgi:hypothetical protein